MKKLFKIAALGTLLFSCTVSVIHAQEGVNPNGEPVEVPADAPPDVPTDAPADALTDAPTDVPTETLEEIPPANQQWISSYLDLQPDYYQPTPLPLRGLAMYYNPGVMERVLVNQLGWGAVTECDECIGRVALLREGDMDRRVWLQRPGHPAEGPFWVIDQAARHDVPGLVRRNWAVDVDYETAMRWEMRGPIPIVVLAGPEQAVDE